MRWLGRVPYDEAARLQASWVARRRAEEVQDTLLLLEHPPVITLGRSSDPAHVLDSADALRDRGIELHESGRGGDVTYHGPGQLIGYPIVALPAARRDAHRYLRDLEEALIRTVATYDVPGRRIPDLTGVWVGDEKLAAIGVRLNSGWITSHGFALNVDCDLAGFDEIVPCGIRGRGVTSLAMLLDSPPGIDEVAGRVAAEVATVLDLELIP